MDKRVLQEYVVIENPGTEVELPTTTSFEVTSGLIAYQFKDYCLKRKFSRLLDKLRSLIPLIE